MWLIYLIFLVLLILFAIEYYWRLQPAYKVAVKLPGGRILPLFGNMDQALSLNPETTIQLAIQNARRYKKAYRFYAFGILHYWPIHAKEYEFIFNSGKYIDKSFMYEFLSPLLGDGLLSSNNKKWLHRRKILTPAFHFNILQKFLCIFKEETINFINQLKTENYAKEVILQDIIPEFTLNNICETAMGVKLNTESGGNEYRKNVNKSGELIVKRFVNPFVYNRTMYSMTSIKRDLMKSTATVHEFTNSVIVKRRNQFTRTRTLNNSNMKSDQNIYEKERYAMLDTLLEAEANSQIDQLGIQDEVNTFMFEGYDTTSTGIMFILFMLANHQDMQQLVYEEISEIFGMSSLEELTIQNYGQLYYLDRFIKETFRLYPPVPYIARRINEDYIGDDIFIPKGSQAHLFIYNIHRDPEQFPNPEHFDPDRFLPENCEKRHIYAYLPFSAGPRNCIGQKFAMLEIKTLITSILLEFKLLPITKPEDVVIISGLVLKTKEPIKVRFSKRVNNCNETP